METLERLLGIYLGSLWREAERMAKIKSLSLALNILKGWRKVTLGYFSAIIAVVMFTAAFFSCLFYNLRAQTIQFDVFNGIMAFIGAISLFFLVWNLREERWLNAFGVRDQLLILLEEQQEVIPLNSSRSFNEEDFARLIDRMLDEKLDKLFQTKIEARQLHEVNKNTEEKSRSYGNA
jgi:hypothetical protein